jgi:hypothetical protein
MRRTAYVALLALMAPGIAACADDIRPQIEEEPDAGSGPDPEVDAAPVGKVTVTDNGDGTSTLVVDATDLEAWIYLDLASLEVLEPADPATSADWDLGLQRFHYALDGGVSGAGQGELVVVDGAVLADVTVAPSEGWVTDAPDDAADEDDLPEYAFEIAEGGWFDYNPETHVLTPKQRVYVMRGAAGDLFAVQIEDYYDDAGSPAWLRFTVKPLEEE